MGKDDTFMTYVDVIHVCGDSESTELVIKTGGEFAFGRHVCGFRGSPMPIIRSNKKKKLNKQNLQRKTKP